MFGSIGSVVAYDPVVTIDVTTHVRLARPSRDLTLAERFYVEALGLDVLYRGTASAPGEHDLLMVGRAGGHWHLELVATDLPPSPSTEDLLVVYLDGPVPDDLVERLLAAGGERVSQSEYWDRWGVTVTDPDGYRLVLSTRGWRNTPAEG
ncbi:glyoxalase/bleomycin resistance protein/dioxygenase [Actinoplanes sp. NBRC 101535]|nr:glyoxalase/bleomycin resistance protein/dioxygenase [Actinoplanes sp. NBRC 101535]